MTIDPRHVSLLPAILANVSNKQLQGMRVAMASAWPRILWTSLHVSSAHDLSAYGPIRLDQTSRVSYLGEPPQGDAFDTFLAVLTKRHLAHAPSI